jgi:hypothetical protein
MPANEEGVCDGEPGQRRHGLHPLAKRFRHLLARRQDRLQQVHPGLSLVWLRPQSAQVHAEALRCEPECCERCDEPEWCGDVPILHTVACGDKSCSGPLCAADGLRLLQAAGGLVHHQLFAQGPQFNGLLVVVGSSDANQSLEGGKGRGRWNGGRIEAARGHCK